MHHFVIDGSRVGSAIRIKAGVVGPEIDSMERFACPSKLVAYAGPAPATHASGGKVTHGRLMKQSNKGLRWAWVEADWTAVRCDPYFRTRYGMRYKHKGAKTAIIAVGGRLLEVIRHVLKENRLYELRPPGTVNSQKITSAALGQA